MSHITEVPVTMEQRYIVNVGKNLWEEVRNFCAENYPAQKLIIAIDEEVNRLHGNTITAGCAKFFDDIHLLTIPQGEQSKSVAQWNKSLNIILKKGIERSTPLLAVGGGVTGDLAGFMAASALRGIPLVHMPTTLLAMVDSSIGGKTGINHETGKNLIGAFYQPDAVFADVNFLETLPDKEWINGLSEILKYAAIAAPALFDSAAECVASGFKPSGKWIELIGKSASIKIDTVIRDTLEAGVRAFLNFGHTFGHALEKNAGYGTISHGEAVLTGMLAAFEASKELGGNLEVNRLDDFLNLYSIRLDTKAVPVDDLIETMKQDKKVKDGNIRLVLLKEWGHPYIHTCRDRQLLHHAWEFALHKINRH